MTTTAVLLEADGDADKALELLASGWKLPAAVAVVRGCPFGKGEAAADGAAKEEAPPPPLSDKDTQAVRTMAERGVPAAAIAATLKLELKDVEATLAVVPAAAATDDAGLPAPLANAVRTMAGSGMTAEAIAATMKLELPAVKQVIASAATASSLAAASSAPAAPAATAGRCPFGFDSKSKGGGAAAAGAAAAFAQANPAALVETLRDRFNARATGDRMSAGQAPRPPSGLGALLRSCRAAEATCMCCSVQRRPGPPCPFWRRLRPPVSSPGAC